MDAKFCRSRSIDLGVLIHTIHCRPQPQAPCVPRVDSNYTRAARVLSELRLVNSTTYARDNNFT